MSHLSDLIEPGPIIEKGNPVIYLSETAQLYSQDFFDVWCVSVYECICLSSDASARVQVLMLCIQIRTTYVILPLELNACASHSLSIFFNSVY